MTGLPACPVLPHLFRPQGPLRPDESSIFAQVWTLPTKKGRAVIGSQHLSQSAIWGASRGPGDGGYLVFLGRMSPKKHPPTVCVDLVF